ncbi:uncharacterized protein VTP21DRAFT_10798 [Calcarisporiella thermophila]|uniref:uncharacterized protein n=1 Tax=Calcarisporiella thermophila TaxID=911321 RepID=UPI003743F520
MESLIQTDFDGGKFLEACVLNKLPAECALVFLPIACERCGSQGLLRREFSSGARPRNQTQRFDRFQTRAELLWAPCQPGARSWKACAQLCGAAITQSHSIQVDYEARAFVTMVWTPESP